MLDRLGAQPCADALEDGFARVPLEGRAHLDELVRRQCAIDLGENRLGQATRAQLNDRIELVGPRLERFALSRRQL